MYVLVTKELDAANAEKLRNAKHILDTVDDPANFHFLSEEFHATTEITSEYKDPNKLIINEKLIPFAIFPEYSMQNNYFHEKNYENSRINKGKIFKDILFKVVLRMQNEGKKYISGKAIDLIIKPSENYVTVNFNFSKKKDNENVVMPSLINYFHNRKELYFDIYKILKENEKKLLKNINNEEFVKDLLALFSVKDWDYKPTYDISNVATTKELVIFESERDVEKRKNKYATLSVLEGNEDSPLFSSGFRRAEVALNKEENLLTMKLDTSLDKADFFNLSIDTLTSNNLEQILENEKLKEFYGNYLNEWMSRYLSLSSFAFKFLEKFQTKILINHI